MIDLDKQATFAEKGFAYSSELDVVRLLLKSDVFASTYTDHLSSNLFREQLKPIVEAAISYWKQYSKLPSNEALVQEIQWKIGSNFSKEKAEVVINALKEMKNDPSDPEYVEAKVQSFIKFQRVNNAVRRCADILTEAKKKNDPSMLDKIEAEIARSLESLTVENPSWFIADLDARTEQRAAEAAGDMDNVIVYPSGIPPLDAIYGKGGLKAGEIGICIAPTGRGKSVFLEWASSSSASMKKNVFYASLELSESLLLDRIDSMVSEIELRAIVQERNDVRERLLEKWQYQEWGEIMFKEFSSLETTSLTIKNEIYRAKRLYNFVPGLIVVDYVDLLQPAHRSKDQDWKNQQTCVKEMRDLGKELNCAVWTASQANRLGRNKQEEGMMITDGDAAESYAKNSVADLILTLNQKKKYFELPDGELKPMILHIPKNRNGKSNVNIGIYTDFKRMAFYCGDYDEHAELEKDALESEAFSEGKKKGKKLHA